MITPGHFYLVITTEGGTALDIEALHRLRMKGLSLQQIAKELNTSKTTVSRLLGGFRKTSSD